MTFKDIGEEIKKRYQVLLYALEGDVITYSGHYVLKVV